MPPSSDPSSISVVIPCRGTLGFLREALDSVERQTLPPNQIIVVDDGSDVDLHDQLSAQFPNVTFIRQERNGVSVARNRGCAHATSEWITFLDADDVWHPERLSRLLQFAKLHPEFDLIGTDQIHFSSPSFTTAGADDREDISNLFDRTLDAVAAVPYRELVGADFMVRNQFGVAALVRRQTFFAAGGFSATLRATEDWNLWLSISTFGRIVKVEEPTYFYRQHSDSSSISLPMAAAGVQGLMTFLLHSQGTSRFVDESRPRLLDHLQEADAMATWYARARTAAERRFAKHLLLQLPGNRREVARAHVILLLARIADRAPHLSRLLRRSRRIGQLASKIHGREGVPMVDER